MIPDEKQLQIDKLKKSIKNDLDEMWSYLLKDEPYYADVEMYQNALEIAHTSITLANRYYIENKKLKEEIALLEKKHLKVHKLIDFDWLITSGGISQKDINKRRDMGWKFVVSVPAKLIHPFAMVSDTATIFSKYTPYPKDRDESVPNVIDKAIKKSEEEKIHKEFWDIANGNEVKDIEVEQGWM